MDVDAGTVAEAAARRRPSIFGRFYFSRGVVAEARPASARQGGGKAAPEPRVGRAGVNASCSGVVMAPAIRPKRDSGVGRRCAVSADLKPPSAAARGGFSASRSRRGAAVSS